MIQVCEYSTQGKRKSNEDSVFVKIYENSLIRAALAVSDGMGGMVAGEVASNITIKTFEKIINEIIKKQINLLTKNLDFIGNKIIEIINNAVYTKSKSNPDYKNMGSTITAAIILPNFEYIILNVGDSRAYLINENLIKQITVDHNAKQEAIDKKIISPDEANTFPFGNALTRSIGESITPKVDVFKGGPLMNGDVLLLSTDGLHSFVDNRRIQYHILRTSKLEENLKNLSKIALENGSDDNISLVAFTPELIPVKLKIPKQTDNYSKKNLNKRKRKKISLFNVAIIFLAILLFVNIYLIFTKLGLLEGNNNEINTLTSAKEISNDKETNDMIKDVTNNFENKISLKNLEVFKKSPQNGEKNVKSNPAIFTWQISGLDSWGQVKLRITIKDAFTDSIIISENINSNQFEFKLKESRTYKWKIDGKLPNDNKYISIDNWSEFTTALVDENTKKIDNQITNNNVTLEIVKITPKNDEQNVNPFPTLFTWQISGLDSWGQVKLRITIKDAFTDSIIISSENIKGNKFEFDLKESKTYKWKVDYKLPNNSQYFNNDKWWKFTTITNSLDSVYNDKDDNIHSNNK